MRPIPLIALALLLITLMYLTEPSSPQPWHAHSASPQLVSMCKSSPDEPECQEVTR